MGGEETQTSRSRAGERKVTLRRDGRKGGAEGCFLQTPHLLMIVGSLAQLSSFVRNETCKSQCNPSMAAFYRTYLFDLESDRVYDSGAEMNFTVSLWLEGELRG